VTATLGYIIFI